ncbi:MAG: hypothetical protein QOC95_1205 [Thermoleophilaceae bacterium]|jgi:hypothetical protein|nr:hypothetical protein [Thermoleophilaceae bacterium]
MSAQCAVHSAQECTAARAQTLPTAHRALRTDTANDAPKRHR